MKFKKLFTRKLPLFLAYFFSAFVSCLFAFILALNFSIPAISSEKTAAKATTGGGAKKATPPVSKIIKDIFKNLKLVISQGFSKKKSSSAVEEEVIAASKPSAPDSGFEGATNELASPPAQMEGALAEGQKVQEVMANQKEEGNFVPIPSKEPELASAPEDWSAGDDSSLPSSDSNLSVGADNAPVGGSDANTAPSELASFQEGATPSESSASFDPAAQEVAAEGGGGSGPKPSAVMPMASDPMNSAEAHSSANFAEAKAIEDSSSTGMDSRDPASSPSVPDATEGMNSTVAADSAGGGGDTQNLDNRSISSTNAEVQSYMAPWIYEFGHQKDPFEDPTKREIAGVVETEDRIVIPQTPPEKYDLKDIILRGIIWDSRRPKALFELPGQEGGYYTLLKGDKIGQHGIIFDIRESEVVVVETHWSGSGEQAKEEQTVKIKKINRITASK